MGKYLELVEGSFTQEHFDKQAIENKPYVAYSVKDKGVIYTIIPNESGTMYTVYCAVKKDISNLTYNEVDLGLSVKWADRNVGATSPEDCGIYCAWGETEGVVYNGKSKITAAQLATIFQPLVGDEMEVTADNVHEILTVMFDEDPGYDLSALYEEAGLILLEKLVYWGNYFDTDKESGYDEYGSPISFKKYTNEDGLKVLESEDDAATVHMGSEYRMPTDIEIQELINNTTQTFIDVDGKEYSKEQVDNDIINIDPGTLKGIRFTGSNSNSIFIPAAGFCEEVLAGIGVTGALWSSSLVGGNDYEAGTLFFFYGGIISADNDSRYRGIPIRGVKP